MAPPLHERFAEPVLDARLHWFREPDCWRVAEAGFLVRFGPECWLKTCVEDESVVLSRLGAVVTRHGYSDWSTQDLSEQVLAISLRISPKGTSYLVEASMEHGGWIPVRLAHLDGDGPMHGGRYACSPRRAVCMPRFRFLRLESI